MTQIVIRYRARFPARSELTTMFIRNDFAQTDIEPA